MAAAKRASVSALSVPFCANVITLRPKVQALAGLIRRQFGQAGIDPFLLFCDPGGGCQPRATQT